LSSPAAPERISLRAHTTRRARARGLTLLEVLVAIGILSLVATLVYGAFDGMSKSRQGIERVADRYHQGRSAVSRMARELQSAFISLHVPLDPNFQTRKTAFIGSHRSPADRIDFTSFSHQRIAAGVHESDQNELSYFGSSDPRSTATDLVRREAKYIDIDPQHGGVVQVMAENIKSFSLTYLDGVTGDWKPEWDSTQLTEAMRLPSQVRIELVLYGANGEPIPFVTKAPIMMQAPLSFGLPR
jgi:general secretion pathway protein J